MITITASNYWKFSKVKQTKEFLNLF